MTSSAPIARTRSTFERAGDAGHVRTERLGHLHGVGAHPSGGPDDQHLLSGLDLGHVAQCLQGGQAGDRDGGGLLEAEVRRLRSELVLRGDGVLREGSLADAEHLVAGGEAGHVLADRLHDPGQVHAQDRVLRRPDPVPRDADRVGQSRHQVPDATIHPRGMDAHQDLVVGHLRWVDVPELEDVGRAVGLLDDCLHEVLLEVGPVAACRRVLTLYAYAVSYTSRAAASSWRAYVVCSAGARRVTMTTDTARTTQGRAPLSRERVLRAGISLADEGGIDSLTMRGLGRALGVEAMSLYNHVANKDDLLDGMVDVVVGDIVVPPAGTPWRSAMRARCISAHEQLLAHPWAAMQITSRYSIGPGMTRYLDATLGRLREGGFSIEGALDAWNALDSHLYGFTLQELNLPFAVEESSTISASVLPQIPADEFPYVVEVLGHVMAQGRREDFEFGLGLILDGLEQAAGWGMRQGY